MLIAGATLTHTPRARSLQRLTFLFLLFCFLSFFPFCVLVCARAVPGKERNKRLPNRIQMVQLSLFLYSTEARLCLGPPHPSPPRAAQAGGSPGAAPSADPRARSPRATPQHPGRRQGSGVQRASWKPFG